MSDNGNNLGDTDSLVAQKGVRRSNICREPSKTTQAQELTIHAEYNNGSSGTVRRDFDSFHERSRGGGG